MNEDTAPQEKQDLLKRVKELESRLEKMEENAELLKHSEEKYRALFEHANDSMFIIDPGTRKILDCNGSAVNHLGYSREELLRLTVDDITGPLAAKKNSAIIKKLKEKGSVVFENVQCHKDGHQIPVEISSRVIAFGHKKVFLSIVRNITERKKAKETMERYRVLFDGIRDSVFVQNIKPGKLPGLFVDVNKSTCQRLGYTREEMLNMSPLDIDAPWTKELYPELIAQLKKKKTARFDADHVAKDGRIIPAEVHSQVFQIGEETVLISIARDITNRKKLEEDLRDANEQLETRVSTRTAQLEAANIKLNREVKERKEAEEALSLSEERFRAIADYTYDWENWTDPGGDIIWVNPAIERVTGYSPEEYKNHPDRLRLVVAEEDYGEMKALLVDGLTNRSSINDVPFRIKHKSGVPRWGSISFQPIYGADGRHLGLRSSIRDITESKKNEIEQEKIKDHLREVQKLEAIGTLAGGISHDFNNILGVIIGYTQLTQGVIEPGHPALKMLDQIMTAGERARDLVRQILAFSRQAEREFEPMHVQPVVEEALALLEATIPRSIHIETHIEEDCGTIMGDPTQVHQVVMNLCTNAYHAIREEGGALRVKLKCLDCPAEESKKDQVPPGRYILLEVVDTGHGMTRDVQERIFDPYFTTKKKDEGSGLGLSVVHGIIKSHQGHISVQSEPGKGTTFRILIPLYETAPREPETAEAEVPRGNNQHILMVDDEEALAEINKTLLESLGYRCTACTDSGAALRVFQQDPGSFHLVLTDMSMPGLSGAELTKEIRKLRPELPVILCTGFSELMTKQQARDFGFRGYIMKPVLSNELARAIRKALDS